jgi:hypothetical protein
MHHCIFYSVFVFLAGLLEEPPNAYDTNATIKAKTLFKSCVNASK